METSTTAQPSSFKIPDTVAKARAWVNTLPLNNFGGTTRQLYQCMTALNKSPLNPVRRIEITEVIKPYAELILDHLGKHLTERSFPLPKKSRKIFDLHQALLLEVAGAYQLSALEMLTKDNINKKLLLISTGRALSYMGRVLTMTYSVYIHQTDSIWRDIHHLYLIACEQKVEKLTIPDKSSITTSCKTIDDIYKLISLISLSNPFSLRIGDIDRITLYFPHILDQVKIDLEPEESTREHAHVVMLNSDEPAALMPLSDVIFSPTARVINAEGVIQTLNNFIKDSADQASRINLDSDHPTMTLSLAERLVKTLTVVRNRRYKRFDRSDKAIITHQISNIAKLIESKSNSKKSIEEDEDAMYENLIFGTGLNHSSPWTEDEEEIDSLEHETGVKLYSWHVLNSSTNGYGLCWKEAESVNTRVGELIAIQDPTDTDAQWQIGCIRWMQYFSDKGLCAGVELLSPFAQSISVESIENRTLAQKLPVTGLYLPRIEGINDQPRIILPDYMFREGDQITFNLKSKSQAIEIIDTNEESGAFAICRYTVLDESEEVETHIPFDDLWEDL